MLIYLTAYGLGSFPKANMDLVVFGSFYAVAFTLQESWLHIQRGKTVTTFILLKILLGLLMKSEFLMDAPFSAL